MSTSTPVLSVVMITYGHEKFIEQAIQGIFLQQTSFLVELIIADDGSPDQTEEIVQKLIPVAPQNIQIRYIKHPVNKGMSANFIWAMQQVRGEFTAFCEGDDYWNDPSKLQQQVEFLQTHEDYSFCCHRYTIEMEQGYGSESSQKNLMQNTDREFAHYHYGEGHLEIDYSLFYNTWVTQPLTTVLRSIYLKDILSLAPKFSYFRDIHLFYLLLQKGKGISLNQFMGVYRLHANGAESGADQAKDLCLKVKLWKELWRAFPKDHQLREQYIEAGLRAMSSLPKKKQFAHSVSLLKMANSPRLVLKIAYYLFL